MSYANVFAAHLVSAQRTARQAQDADLRRSRRTRRTDASGRPEVEPQTRTSPPLRSPVSPAGLVPRFGQAG